MSVIKRVPKPYVYVLLATSGATIFLACLLLWITLSNIAAGSATILVVVVVIALIPAAHEQI